MSSGVPTREHIVAAGLVGTVVVLVGFASGLGLTHPASANAGTETQAAGPTGGHAGQPGSAGGGAAGGAPTGGVNYIGTPQSGGLPGGGLPGLAGLLWPTGVPGTGGPASGPVGGGSSPLPSSPTGSTPPTTTIPGGPLTSPTCQPGLVQGVLTTATSAVNAIPLLGGLTSGLTDGTASPVGGLTNTLVGSCAPPISTPAGAPAAAPAVGQAVVVTTTPVAGP